MKSAFKSVTVFILSSDENELLRETISLIYKGVDAEDLDRIVVVAKNDRCTAFNTAKELIKSGVYGKLELYVQKSSDVIECFAELPPMTEGSHFIIMSADLENDPCTVADLIESAKKHPDSVICAAKWMKGSVVEDYGTFRKFCSRAVNIFVSLLYGLKIKEPFSVFQIYPLSVYKRMKYSGTSDFLFEYTLLPLSEGVSYIEIPTVFRKRNEGKSHFGFIYLSRFALKFCFTAVKLRFRRKQTNK